MTIAPGWLTALLVAAGWSTLFSLSTTPWIRGYRNFGLLACYLIGVAMPFFAGWRPALATWVLLGVSSGLLYFLHEAAGYLRSRDPAAAPRLRVLADGLLVWPVLIPEAIENLLAEAGVLKPAVLAAGAEGGDGGEVEPPGDGGG